MFPKQKEARDDTAWLTHNVPTVYYGKWQQTVQVALEVCAAATAFIVRRQPEQLQLLVVNEGASEHLIPNRTTPINRSPYFQNLEAQRTFYQYDEPQGQEDGLCPQGVLFSVGVPLIWPDGSVFGALCASKTTADTVSPLVKKVFLQLKESIENDFRIIHYSRLLQKHKETLEGTVAERTRDLRETKEQLELELERRVAAEAALAWELKVNITLADLGSTMIAPDQTIEQIADKVLASARELTASAHGYVSEIDPETRENVGYTLTSMLEGSCNIAGSERKIAFSRNDDGVYPSLWGYALNSGEEFWTNNPDDHPSRTGLPQGHVYIARFLSVPVKYQGEVVGQIALANASSDYGQQHMDAVRRLGEFYALAIMNRRNAGEHARLEAQLRQASKMEAIGVLAGGIAHDFNNMLSIIVGNIDAMSHKLGANTSVDGNVKNIRETAARAKKLVNQILSYSRQTPRELVPTDLAETVANTLKLLRATIPVTVELQLDLKAKASCINADTTGLQQIFINLCANAVQAMAERGVLKVGLDTVETSALTGLVGVDESVARYARLSFVDNGSGMDRDTVEQIFTPFYTTKEVGAGTGMGLSVVHGIVEQHHGFITVESKQGEGSRFNLYFPLIDEVEQEEVAPDVHVDLTGGKENILFVDDEECIAFTCKELLEFHGYSVSSVMNATEALALFKKAPQDYDLVITDQTMPEMTGAELAKEMLQIRPDVPIVLCSGYRNDLSAQEISDIGIREFCLKPMDMEQLVSVTRRVLNST